MSDINPECCGSHCIKPTAQVRVYPLGGGANLILCFECWAHENRYRYNRANAGDVDPANFPQENWWTAKVYPEESDA